MVHIQLLNIGWKTGIGATVVKFLLLINIFFGMSRKIASSFIFPKDSCKSIYFMVVRVAIGKELKVWLGS